MLPFLGFCFLALLNPVSSQSGGTFNEPPGERRDQTYRVLEFEDGTINQRFKGVMRYYCTFRGKWSVERHPRDFPKSPSFSQPVLVSHSNGYRMWTGTEAATLGVEALAEVSNTVRGIPWLCFSCMCLLGPMGSSTPVYAIVPNSQYPFRSTH